MGFTKSMSVIVAAILLGLTTNSLAAQPKCKKSVSRESRIFSPQDIESQNLYSQYSYNSFERDPRFLVHVTSDSQHPLFAESKKSKEQLSENVSFRESLSNRLKIEAVMKDFSLTRNQAVELQAILRRYYPKASNEDFMSVLELVRAGKSMSGVRWENIKKAKFVVALDVDGTLLDQDYQTRYPITGVHQHIYSYGGKIHSVAMSPGWEGLIRGIKQRGGSVVIFSRNSDELIQNMFESIKLDGVPLAEVADAIFSSSHMVINPADRDLIHRRKIHEIVTKDLRLLGGQKAIIVDDNPDFVLQRDQTRVVSRFDSRTLDPETYIESKARSGSLHTEPLGNDGFFVRFFPELSEVKEPTKNKPKKKVDIQALKEAREQEMLSVLKEIDAALVVASKKGISFAEAYARFSKLSLKIFERQQEDSLNELN